MQGCGAEPIWESSNWTLESSCNGQSQTGDVALLSQQEEYIASSQALGEQNFHCYWESALATPRSTLPWWPPSKFLGFSSLAILLCLSPCLLCYLLNDIKIT